MGRRTDVTGAFGYDLRLLAGSTIIAQDVNNYTPAPGAFVHSQIQYQSLVNDPLAGQTLRLYFTTTGNTSTQVNFDDIRLDATAVPLPGAVWLLATGLIGLGAVGFRRRRS